MPFVMKCKVLIKVISTVFGLVLYAYILNFRMIKDIFDLTLNPYHFTPNFIHSSS